MSVYKTINSILYANLLLLLLFSINIQCKTVRKKIPIRQLATQSQTAYLSRMGMSTAGGQVVVKLNKYGEQFPDLNNLKLGLLTDEDFYAHKNAQSCQQKQQYYKQTFRIKFFSPTQGMSTIPISKNNQQHLYFFYVYTCDFVDADEDNQSMLGVDLIMVNHGLGISENGAVFWPYLIMASLCVGLGYRFHKDVLQFIKMNKNLSSVLMCVGFLIGTMAIFAKFFDAISNISTQEQSQFFSALYNTLKVLQEATMATILVSIAWGWLLNNENYKVLYYSIVGGVTVMNFLSEIISLINKQQISNQNLYQGGIGKLALILRVVICVIFVSGCLYVSLQTIPKRQKFINTYAEVGAIYLLTNLISLLCSSIFAHDYNHGQTIPTLQDILRFCCIIYLCYLFAYPKQISYQQIGFGVHLEEENNSCIQRQDFGVDTKQQQPSNQSSSHGSIMQPPSLINLDESPTIVQGKKQMIAEQAQKVQYLIENTAFDISLLQKKEENPFDTSRTLGKQIDISMQNINDTEIQKQGIKRITAGNTGSHHPQRIKSKNKAKKNKNDKKILLHPDNIEDGQQQNNMQSSTQYMNKMESSTQYLSSQVQPTTQKKQPVPEVQQVRQFKKQQQTVKAQQIHNKPESTQPKIKVNQEQISDDEA